MYIPECAYLYFYALFEGKLASYMVYTLGFSEANNPRSDTIFVGQIPFDINEEELKLYFPGCLSVRIKRDKYRGYSKG